MSGLGAWIWGTSQIDDAVDKATSELIPSGSEDIALNLEICDQIRSKSAPAKDAMRALKRRLNQKNPNVQLLALTLTDVCVKNGGDLFLAEVMSREFLDNLVSILKIPGLNHDVKSTILRLVQNWSIALEGKPNLGCIGQIYKTLLSEGYKFPPKDLTSANSAMVDTQIAPEWIDSDVCLHCRTPFTFTNRKHHCRNCGKVYDQACSSKSMKLPHFGITQDVRVCDECYKKITRKLDKADKPHKRLSNHRPAANELADAELQRAIQLSLQEAASRRPGYTPSQPSPSRWGYSEPPLIDRSTYSSNRRTTTVVEEDDPELKAAIEASLREANAPKPSAPIVSTPTSEKRAYKYNGAQESAPLPSHPPPPKIPTYELAPLETDTIMTFNQTVEQVQTQGGRDLSRYPAVTELYEKANGLRPKLALSLDDAGRKEQVLSDMHDKLSQAVKLYDQILSQQVAQPRWRSNSTAYNYGYQPQQPYTETAPNGYVQWASPSPMQYQVPSESASGSPVSHLASSTQAMRLGSQLQAYQQVPRAQPEQQSMIASHGFVSPVQSPSTYSLPTSSTPHTMQNSQPMQMLPALPQSLPPASQYPVHSPPPPPPSFQHNQPTTTATTTSSALARHHTVTYHSLPSGPPPSSPHLVRSNTTAYAASQRPAQQHLLHPHHHHHQQQQPVQHAAAPTTLPQFPNVPTSAPQPAYSMYGSSVPSPFAQNEERKEALLIDL